MVLEDLKILFPSANDNVLSLYIRMAQKAILNYLNNPLITDASLYDDAVIAHVTIAYSKRGNEGMTQFAQGSRSGTYETKLSSNVKDLLPNPYVKVMG